MSKSVFIWQRPKTLPETELKKEQVVRVRRVNIKCPCCRHEIQIKFELKEMPFGGSVSQPY